MYYGNSQYSGSGTVYTGSKALNSDNGLNVEITIRTGFSDQDSTTNGVEVSLTNNLNTVTYWTAVGFGSSVMVGTFTIICANTFMERQLGNHAVGQSLTATGMGACSNINNALSWELNGLTASNQYDFPSDGKPLPIIWAFGSSVTFNGHTPDNRGMDTVTFTCVYNCMNEEKSNSATIIIISAVIGVVLLLIIVGLLFVFLNRKRQMTSEVTLEMR